MDYDGFLACDLLSSILLDPDFGASKLEPLGAKPVEVEVDGKVEVRVLPSGRVAIIFEKQFDSCYEFLKDLILGELVKHGMIPYDTYEKGLAVELTSSDGTMGRLEHRIPTRWGYVEKYVDWMFIDSKLIMYGVYVVPKELASVYYCAFTLKCMRGEKYN